MACYKTARLKRSINSNLVEGFRIQVLCPSNDKSYWALGQALDKAGFQNQYGGCDTDYYWEWFD